MVLIQFWLIVIYSPYLLALHKNYQILLRLKTRIMKKIEMCFLEYKFTVFAEEKLLNRFSSFWSPFLSAPQKHDKFIEWKIHFFYNQNSKTIVNQEKQEIIHYSNSICDLTELNNLFREAIVKITSLYGMIWLHCSAIHQDSKTILFLGNKGDGKTTLLLNYLNSNSNCFFIGNDQLPLFIHDKKLCTMCWRPDIKIQSSIDSNAKELLLVNHNDLSFINFEKMSQRVNKKIIASTNNHSIKFEANKIYPVNQIVVLNNIQNFSDCTFEEFINNFETNNECVSAHKLQDLAKYMPYWNKRILGLIVSDKSKKENENILTACKNIDLVKVGNRLNFNEVKNYLKRRFL